MYLTGNHTTMQGTWLAQESADDRCGSGRVRRLINERRRPPAGGGVHRVRVRRCTQTAESGTGRIVLVKARGRCPDDPAHDRSVGRGPHPLAPPATGIPHTWMRY
jgi:hypothetical protein